MEYNKTEQLIEQKLKIMKREHTKARKLLTGFICLVIAVTMTAGVPASSFAADKSPTATQGVYWFDPHEVGMDLTDTFIFDDALLTGDSLGYNKKLATMSFELAIASISSEREPKTEAGYKNKSRNLKAYLEDNGFLDFATNADYKKIMTTTTMGVACAHKKIKDNGKTYTLLAIVPRSAGYESEWGGNFMMGESGEHEEFRNGKNKVLGFAKEYVAKNGIKGDIKVWTAGYKVCIARNKAMTKGLKVITVKGKNKESHTIRNLKKGTRYYVEVRAIWKKGKTEYTGSSATKTARVK